MKQAILQGRSICKTFSQGSKENLVLDHVDIDIYNGDFTIIMGSSGAGKSTLLYALSGMDHITGGKVIYKGEEISHYTENQMARLRAREFGFVFQQTHLVSNLTLYENVAVAGYVSDGEKKKDISTKAKELLQQMDVGHAKHRLPSQVSGGEAQRAAIARAIIGSPGLLFADEPTGSLNKSNSEQVLNLLLKLNERGQSILMVTHDLRAAIRGTRIIYLEDGKILDEKKLPPYHEDNPKERESMISAWLTSLQW